MSLRIYNTLSHEKEPFEPLHAGQVSMYVCGPTVYSQAHIGHAMSSIVFDVVRRYLEYTGYTVRYAMNYTDVDDKIIERAAKEGVDPLALAERHIQDYQRHLVDLNILPATVNPRATREMSNIVDLIAGLIDRGFAYQADGDVYFRVCKDPDYGKLSRRRLDEMEAGARIAVDERKEYPMDFALWKAGRPGEPVWESPWSSGRPGWHIECSAMSMHHLGEQIDIHGGGNDLIFPHHENEIAQTESLTEKQFARYWMHNGMLQLTGEKMSKSLGNLITIEEFLEKHEADVFRLIVLNSGYRGPLAFSDQVVAQAESGLARLRSALRPIAPGSNGVSSEASQTLEEQIADTRTGFLQCMDEDFNTAGALGQLFDLVRASNQARDSGASRSSLEDAQVTLRELAGVLGLRLERDQQSDMQLGALVDVLLEVRAELRREKLWALSDRIRDRLAEVGITIEDTRDGAIWRADR